VELPHLVVLLKLDLMDNKDLMEHGVNGDNLVNMEKVYKDQKDAQKVGRQKILPHLVKQDLLVNKELKDNREEGEEMDKKDKMDKLVKMDKMEIQENLVVWEEIMVKMELILHREQQEEEEQQFLVKVDNIMLLLNQEHLHYLVV
jgi:hypothetical protein